MIDAQRLGVKCYPGLVVRFPAKSVLPRYSCRVRLTAELLCGFSMKRLLSLLCVILVLSFGTVPAQSEPIQVLHFDGTHEPSTDTFSGAVREKMSTWLNGPDGEGRFAATYVRSRSGGGLASALASNPGTRVLILDVSNRSNIFNAADREALQGFYASGRSALMLDGSFGIRSGAARVNRTVVFPGHEGSSGGLLINQIRALDKAGGGVLIGTDHDDWQAAANGALRALVPDARFRGLTNPSTDGAFLGDTLLRGQATVTPIHLFRHWESIPNQGEAPVGQFTDFRGSGLTLFALVEAADKPGGGRKRPYISASFSPGDARYDIDSDVAPEPALPDNMPTRKGPPR